MMKKEDNDVHAVTLQHQALPTELLTCLVILISRVSAVRDRFESVATYNAKVQQQINSDKPTCLYMYVGTIGDGFLKRFTKLTFSLSFSIINIIFSIVKYRPVNGEYTTHFRSINIPVSVRLTC